jgi:hypothetical protein
MVKGHWSRGETSGVNRHKNLTSFTRSVCQVVDKRSQEAEVVFLCLDLRRLPGCCCIAELGKAWHVSTVASSVSSF